MHSIPLTQYITCLRSGIFPVQPLFTVSTTFPAALVQRIVHVRVSRPLLALAIAFLATCARCLALSLQHCGCKVVGTRVSNVYSAVLIAEASFSGT